MDTLTPPTVELAPPPPAPGGRFALPRPPGSADALLIAQAARAAHGRSHLTVVITADPHDAPRLVDEIAYFDPALAVRPLPDWETLP
ncbi:MAG: hypothetical protein ACK54L_22025, partial [Betaproteobacteria bacterium]